MSRILTIPGPESPVAIRARDIVILDVVQLAGQWTVKVFINSGGNEYTAYTHSTDTIEEAIGLLESITEDWETALSDEAYTVRRQF